MIAVQHDLVKDLVAVQVDRAASHLAAKDGYLVCGTVAQVDLLSQVLVVANAEIGLAEIEAILAVQDEILEGKAAPSLIDMRQIKSTTREAREYSTGAKYTPAVALLIASPISRILGNFFINYSQPPYPTRLFTSEDEALDWLKGFVD